MSGWNFTATGTNAAGQPVTITTDIHVTTPVSLDDSLQGPIIIAPKIRDIFEKLGFTVEITAIRHSLES